MVRRIGKLLVANRGEVARRITRTCRDLGIRVVAVYSDADEREPFVAEADESVHLPGYAATDTYLRGDLVVDAAKRTGADAVHPGYGFLSENAEFARACIEAGLVFVGPSPESIDAMGSKIAAKKIMEKAGVRVLEAAELPPAASAEEIEAAADAFGYPLLVKASAGGGGKGMRVVDASERLAAAVASAGREAAAAFDDDSVFIERYLSEPHHVEFQIIGDSAGEIVHLFERECSIQRRHQKIIEETPSPALDAALRKAMGAAAVTAAEAVGYVGVGTVEFLLSGGEFYFLEMNTRLQVEHPVTEMVTGIDLVAEQIRIAEGAPVSEAVRNAVAAGHAIEARLYAEDPSRDFLPAPGRLVRLRVPTTVRTDAGPSDGSVVGPHYDPMIAKIVAHGRDRDAAAAKLAEALADAEIYGLTTNRELLVRVLRSPRFRAGDTTTGFLDDVDPAVLSAPLVADHAPHAIAATIAAQEGRRRASPVLGSIPSGWRNVPSGLQLQEWTVAGSAIAVGYRFTPQGLIVEVDGSPVSAEVHEASPTEVDMTVAGVRRRYRAHREGRRMWVSSPLGQSDLTQVSRFREVMAADASGSLRSPMPGKVVELRVAEGAAVSRGDVIVVIEAMKMEHAVTAPGSGLLAEMLVAVGDQVEADQVLAVVSTDGSE